MRFNILLLICFLSLDASGSFHREDGTPRFPFFAAFVKKTSPTVDKWKKKTSDRFYRGNEPLFPSSFKEFLVVFDGWKKPAVQPFLTEKARKSIYKERDKGQKAGLTESQNQKLQDHCLKDARVLNTKETRRSLYWDPKEPSSMTYMKTFSQPI